MLAVCSINSVWRKSLIWRTVSLVPKRILRKRQERSLGRLLGWVVLCSGESLFHLARVEGWSCPSFSLQRCRSLANPSTTNSTPPSSSSTFATNPSSSTADS
ncbi:hypothetical protein FF2_003303 [Malus domestica]